jgi:hypothetical protein
MASSFQSKLASDPVDLSYKTAPTDVSALALLAALRDYEQCTANAAADLVSNNSRSNGASRTDADEEY